MQPFHANICRCNRSEKSSNLLSKVVDRPLVREGAYSYTFFCSSNFLKQWWGRIHEHISTNLTFSYSSAYTHLSADLEVINYFEKSLETLSRSQFFALGLASVYTCLMLAFDWWFGSCYPLISWKIRGVKDNRLLAVFFPWITRMCFEVTARTALFPAHEYL